MLQLDHILHRFDRSDWELKVPCLSILPGKILSIIGPNGSGKSTLLRIAAGILTPLKGRILLKEQQINRMKRPVIARALGYLPQELASEYDLTVLDLIRMGRYPYTGILGRLDVHDIEAVEQSLKQAGLQNLRNRPLSRLSGGEKKRAFLASILAQKPGILLLDEPTSALDLNRQVEFFHILQTLADEGIGIAVVTHDLNLASLFSDSIFLLFQGRCLTWGPPNEVLTRESIQTAYGHEILMGKHPEADRPSLLPRIKGIKTE